MGEVTMKRRFYLALCAAIFAYAPVCLAQTYPNQTVRIIVPFPAGGTTDILAREVGDQLSTKWKVPVVIDNRAGASGTIGSERLIKSTPDGYTLMITATHHVINPSLYKHLNYDTKKDFTAIALIASVPNLLVVHPTSSAKNVQDLIRLAKQNPGKLNFGSAGVGGANHLSGELFAYDTGIKITHIPYKGEAPALNDLLGGHISLMFGSLPAVLPQVRAGNLRALGITSIKRAAASPDIPTIDEAGVKGFDATSWFGMYGPPNMPQDVLRKLSNDVLDVLKSPVIKAKFAEQGAEPGTLSQPDFAKFVIAEIDKWNGVITRANIRIDQ
jgi:tripartite-type tricarboxylate transporter receptor subunit TctC